jgi:hypothetical protein
MRKGKKRNKSRKVIAFLQRCPNCGERGSMREKGIDGRHAEADSLGLGNQPGTYSIRERKRVSQDQSPMRSIASEFGRYSG